jgi:hypothetical protein
MTSTRIQLVVIAIAAVWVGWLFAAQGPLHGTASETTSAYSCASIASQAGVGHGNDRTLPASDGSDGPLSLNDIRPEGAPQDASFFYAEAIYRDQQVAALDQWLQARCDAERHSRGTAILLVAAGALATLIVIGGASSRRTSSMSSS